MQRQHLLHIGLSLAVNVLFSWTLLPFIIPPFDGYSSSELLEVLLWQGIGTVGWLFAILGVALSIPFNARSVSADSVMFVLMYPAIQLLLIRSVISKTPRRGELILMHGFVAFSFAVVWYRVLNGYDFMSG